MREQESKRQMANEPERHPLDPHPDDELPASSTPTNDEQNSFEPEFSTEAKADESALTQPNRPLLKPSLILLGSGFAVAFLAGVAASNSEPNSTGETLGSWMNRAGVITMLVAFCGILFAYRFDWLRQLYSRQNAPAWFRSEMPSLLAWNTLAVLAVWCILLSLKPLLGNMLVVLALAILILHTSLAVTMAIFNKGIWRASGIGFACAVLLLFSGGGTNLIFGFVSQTMYSSRRGDVSVTAFILGYLFIVSNGLLAASYVWLLGFIQRKSESHSGSKSDESEAIAPS